MMKTRIMFLATVLACLLLVPVALAQTGGAGPVPAYTVQTGTSAGGGYQLTNLVWHVSGAAGGSYSLATSYRVTGSGNQCCCTYLPLILRNK